MAIQYSCDFCGEPIEDEFRIELAASGLTSDPDEEAAYVSPYGNGQLAQYHASETRPCWSEMLDRLALIHGVSTDIARSPEAVKIEPRAEGGAQVIRFPTNGHRTGARSYSDAELFEIITAALKDLPLDLADEHDERIYLAYLAAGQAIRPDDALTWKLEELRSTVLGEAVA